MIQWYPGHMAKAFREIDGLIKHVDCILVLLDARIPKSSFNPDIMKRCQNKKVLFVYTKTDLADQKKLESFRHLYDEFGESIFINLKKGNAKELLTKAIIKSQVEKRQKDALKGLRPKAIKVMVLGIPNVGKSTLINALVGKKIASVGNKPGVTKAEQWIKINENFELLDTPGVLWPKFEDEEVGFNLALTGSIKDDILPIEDVVSFGVERIEKLYPNSIEKRYNIKVNDPKAFIADLIKAKNIYTSKAPDSHKACMIFLNDLRSGAIGEFCLDE